jgi:retron-type reverse transcriptase
MVLALSLDVKGAFDRVNKQRLLHRLIEVGIAGNIVRWVRSFLTNRRVMLVIDGRTRETHDIHAGLPQGSPATPVLFILSISAIFLWLKERHPSMRAISFVDDIGLVVRYNDLDEGTREMESVARHVVEWGDSNQVEFEISTPSSANGPRASARIRIGVQQFSINREATR